MSWWCRRSGRFEQTGDLFAPYRLVDGQGVTVEPVAVFFAELTACGRPATTQRSYGMDLLRWLRFLWALGVAWDQATRVEATALLHTLDTAAANVARLEESLTLASQQHPDADITPAFPAWAPC